MSDEAKQGDKPFPVNPYPPPEPIQCVHKYVNGVCIHCGAKEPNK